MALLDYVSGDYARAVGPDGRVLAEDEFREQQGFVAEVARELKAAQGAADLDARAAALAARIAAHGSPAAVAADARALRDQIAQRYGVVLLPAHPPDVARGRALYQLACASCHGEGGLPRADIGELHLAGKLPTLAAADEVKELTPQRAFSAVTYGVPNTAMPSFEDALDERSRWDLAFYALTLAHPDAAQNGRPLARAAMLPTGYREVAVLSDDQLRKELAGKGFDERDRERILAALRRGPWDGEGGAGAGRLGSARQALSDALEADAKGDRESARRSLLAMYLDEFEPHEPSLRARDAALVAQVEKSFLTLRAAIESGTLAQAKSAGAELDSLLARADALESGQSALIAFFAALVIALREGAEAALLIAALLALLRKAGRERDARAVHAGTLAALAAGAVTWWLSGALLQLSGMRREWLEGIFQLATAVLLVYAGHWLLAWAGATRLLGQLGHRASAKSAAVIFVIAFASIYREMFEVVLFFRGLLLESAGAGAAVLGGALAGLCALAAGVFVFQKLGRRLHPKPLMVACGALLCALALVLVGNGVRSLQKTATLPLHVWTGVELPALGIYGTREGLLAQGSVALVLAGAALRRRKRREEARARAAEEAHA